MIHDAEDQKAIFKILRNAEAQVTKMELESGFFSTNGQVAYLVESEIKAIRDCYKRHNRHGIVGLYYY